MCFSALRAKISGEEIIKSEVIDVKDINVKSLDDFDASKIPGEDGRFYPKWWTHVLRVNEGVAEYSPLRYQLLPHFCKEDRYTMINKKTGRKKELKTFNARIDGLEKREAWKKIFGKKHAVVPIEAFYEWVPHKGKVKQIAFHPQDDQIMWAACLWDRWENEGKIIESFAMITDEPHPDVLRMGHDRTPIILQEDVIKYWLRPENEDISEIYEILDQKKPLGFESRWVD